MTRDEYRHRDTYDNQSNGSQSTPQKAANAMSISQLMNNDDAPGSSPVLQSGGQETEDEASEVETKMEVDEAYEPYLKGRKKRTSSVKKRAPSRVVPLTEPTRRSSRSSAKREDEIFVNGHANGTITADSDSELDEHLYQREVSIYMAQVQQRQRIILAEYHRRVAERKADAHARILAKYEKRVAIADAKRREREIEEELLRTVDKQKKRKKKKRVKKEEPAPPPPKRDPAKRQEKALENALTKAFKEIARKDIPKAFRVYQQSQLSRITNCKKLAQVSAKEARRPNFRTTKTTKDIQGKARRAMREMLTFWRRNEREERDSRKRAEKEALDKAKKEEEERESKRQARKLNFLITQTELYSHFIGNKIKTSEAEEIDTDGKAVVGASAGPEATKDPNEKAIKSLTDAPEAMDQDQELGELDFENADDATLQEYARRGAQSAVTAAKERAQAFDQQSKVGLGEVDFDGDDMNFQNPTSLPGEIQVAQPKMLMCELKEYQLKGLNWLANLYEQGINGILADEMGLGKTVQSIALMSYLAETHDIWGPFLIIAPASTLHNWQQELTRFVPELKALPYWGNAKDRKILRKFWNRKQLTYSKDAPFHVLITSYQLVVSDEKYFQRVKWQYMVLDEAQAIKSSTSARWKTLLSFQCRNRLLLTGTPIQNTMQELWALLHFIMPSLFDSHDEFSEWFSKDIENHAENKGSLDQHQLQRLHMILKPFMLRRIKKNVQHELGDKIEKDVYCNLTARQRHLYRGLKEKISTSELLEKLTSLNDGDSVDNLMNLVMQFRKVCNHPELFERADVEAPYAFCEHSVTAQISREGDVPLVPYNTANHIKYAVPKTIYRSGGILNVVSEESNAGFRHKYLSNLMNIWSTNHIHDAASEGDPEWSFLRFVDHSPREAAKAAHGNVLDRFRAVLKYLRQEEVAQYAEKENARPNSMLLVREPRPIARGILASLQTVQQNAVRDQLLENLDPCFQPKAVAPPVDRTCPDRGFYNDIDQQLFDPLLTMSLVGTPKIQPTSSLLRQELSELNEIIPYDGWLGSAPQGYSNMRVPPMKNLIMDSGKLSALDRLLTELKAGGHRVLIYFQMTRMIDLMEEYLTYRKHKYLRLDGSSKISDRRDMVQDWQTRPDIFVFLLSTRAGGLGINLTAADTVIFYDSDWNPTVDQQAMDRAHRLGQTKQVTVYRLITKGTIEERILQRAKQKDQIQKVVISGGDFKQAGVGSGADFKPREVLSLLLDDDEQQLAAEAVAASAAKRKLGEATGTSTKRQKTSRDGTPVISSGTLEDMWHEGEGTFDDSPSTGASTPGHYGYASVGPLPMKKGAGRRKPGPKPGTKKSTGNGAGKRRSASAAATRAILENSDI